MEPQAHLHNDSPSEKLYILSICNAYLCVHVYYVIVVVHMYIPTLFTQRLLIFLSTKSNIDCQYSAVYL